MNRTISTIGLAAALAGGGTVAADRAIDPYTDTGAHLEITTKAVLQNAGSSKASLIKERPEVRLSKWSGEAEFGVRYDTVKAVGSRAFLTDRMEWKGANEEVHAYPLEATGQMEDGGFEIEIYLKEPPQTNVFAFAIDGADELDFLYQPELSEDEIEQGATRPDNVVGSYAVYHKEKRDSVEGSANYATGKAFHIFRPRAIDANGNEVWGVLYYADGVLSVEVDSSWLVDAAYPVRIDPTFGYTTTGASSASVTIGDFTEGAMASRYAFATSETVSTISVYGSAGGSGGGPGTYSATIYQDTGSLPVARLAYKTAVISSTVQWWNFTLDTPYAATAGNYWLGLNKQEFSFGFTYRYDAGGTSRYCNDGGGFGTPPPNPFCTDASAGTRKISVYATYAGPPSTGSGDAFFFD